MLSVLSNEIAQLYNRLFNQDIRSIAVCSSCTGEGATTVATLLAQHCLLMGKKTLLVDLNIYHPSLNALLPNELALQGGEMNTVDNCLAQPELIEQNELALVGVIAPKRKDAILKLRNTKVINSYIKQWHNEFDCIIIDTTALSRVNQNNIPADYVAKECDGAILVVEAGKTPEETIEDSLTLLNRSGVNLLGTVLNDKNNPSLKSELLRSLASNAFLPKWANHYIKRMILNSKLLNLSV